MGARAGIAGLGITDMGKVFGRTVSDFAGEAIALALEDAGLQARDLDGLLIKSRSFFALAEGSIGTDWYKDSIVATVLRRNKPLERLDPRGEHCFVFTVPSGQNECLRQP